MKKLVALLSLLLITSSLLAAVKATVDRTNVALGESFTLTINLPNDHVQPNLEPLKKDFQLYGTSSSSSTSIINGKSNSSYTVTTTLMPKHLGKLTIPALQVGQVQTQPIVITVSKVTATNIGGNKSDVFLQADVSSKTPYVDSPVIYTLKLYFAKSLQDGNIIPTQVNGVKMQPLGKQKNYGAQINHKDYQVVEQRYLLSVDHAGKITIPSVTFQGAIVSNSQSDMFGFPSSKPVSISSKAITLAVKAIPRKIDPNQWLPAQQVSLSSDWSPETQQLTVGQPITRTITLSAVGITANELPDINFNVPANVNAYPDQPTTSQKVIDGQLHSEKIYKIAYVPTQHGKITFPEISVNWWDTTIDSAKVANLAAKTFPTLPGQLTPSTPKLSTPALRISAAPAKSVATTTPITKTIIQQENNVLWQWLTFVFAGLWIVTLALYFFKRKKSTAKVTDKTERNLPNITALKQACESNTARLIQSTLIKWAQSYWQDPELTSLAMVANKFANAEVKQQIHLLEKAIYTGQDYQQGAELLRAIQVFLKQKNTKTKSDALQPLYPE